MYLLFSVFTEYLKYLSIRRQRDVKSLNVSTFFFSAGTAWSAAVYFVASELRFASVRGATENAGVENAIRSKLQGRKMREWK